MPGVRFATMRRSERVAKVEVERQGFYIVLRYDDVSQVLREQQSNDVPFRALTRRARVDMLDCFRSELKHLFLVKDLKLLFRSEVSEVA